MNSYEFRLTPAYCLFNGVAVLFQKGTFICFLIENFENEILKENLKKAFINHLRFVQKQEECPELYKRLEKIEFRKGDRNDIRKCVSNLYEEKSEKELAFKKNQLDEENDGAAVILLDAIISEAVNKGATDIHIEENQIKFRVNGRLRYLRKIENDVSKELIQRIKLLSGMNVLEHKKCQDGHFCYGEEKTVFVRVSTMPVVSKRFNSNSESVVLRLLDTSRIPLSLSFLGFNSIQIEKLENLTELKNGLVIISGPTGAGKSTTAASILLEILKNNSESLKIVSLEDPPEYLIPGVTQIQINSEQGNSFAEALTHIFRQDPDVIFIGEIRDEKSCETAIRASLTGHLVFGTLHSSSVSGAFLRLENLGVQQKILASVLRGIILQEMNFYKQKQNLLADVAIPVEKFSQKLKENSSILELEDLFEHFTNVGQVLKKTVGSKYEKEFSARSYNSAPRKKVPVAKIPVIKNSKGKSIKEA